jgi:hypothetical protein
VGLVNDNDAGTDAVQNVNIVSAAPDLDRDGREDKYETMDVASAARFAWNLMRRHAGR